MAVGDKACFFAWQRLWRDARRPEFSRPRGSPVQTHLGADADDALLCGNSPNTLERVRVETYGRPHPTVYTQSAWISTKRAMQDALAAMRGRPYPLAWIDDASYGGTIQSGGAASFETTAAHRLVAGDRVLIFRAAAKVFVIRTVLATGTSTTGTLTQNLAPYSMLAGDKILRISSLWDSVWLEDMQPVGKAAAGGDFYNPSLLFDFVGTPTTRYDRVVADLTA